jgi:beta-glucanase (GH16 family)
MRKIHLQLLFNVKAIKVLIILGLASIPAIHVSGQLFIEAESYKTMLGVQTEGTADNGGGINVGWIDAGDWMDYSVNIPISGDYVFSFRAASLNGGGLITVFKGITSLGMASITATGGWQIWQNKASSTIALTEGTQTLRVKATTGGFNLNWFEMKLISPEDKSAPTKPEIIESASTVHDISLKWTQSTDEGSALAGYKILDNTSIIGITTDTVFKLSKLIPGKEFNLKVFAFDIAGNTSDTSILTLSTQLPDWDLVWSDEFDEASINTSKWNFSTGPNNANNEKQYYTSKNASIVDGKLVISAKIEAMGGMPYTSAKLSSINKGDWCYGRIDVKAKLPAAGGTWPAIWMMPTKSVYGGWPNSGEIDIMEHVANNLGWVFGTVHTGAYNHTKGTQKGGGKTISDCHLAFHEYSIEWYPDRIDFYFDNIHYFTFKNDNKTFMEWPYDQKFYLILNIAVGGDLGGTVNPNAVWPSNMEIDYVRVYDLKIGQNDTVAPSNPTDVLAIPSGVSANLSWKPSKDDQYIKTYYIFKGEELIDSTSSTSIKIGGLDPFTEYTFSIQAVDFGGNSSDKISVTTTTTDVTSYAVPGKFEAENFIYMSGIQTETCTDAGGGTNIAFINENDWMEYSIDVKNTGTYFFATRVAAQTLKGSFQVLDKNKNVLTTVATPITGAWQKWVTVVSSGFNLDAGVQRITIKSLAYDYNLNWYDITDNPTKYVTSLGNTENNSANIYPNPLLGNKLTIEMPDISPADIRIKNLEGKELFTIHKDFGQKNITIDNLNMKPGIYIVNTSSLYGNKNFKLILL